MPSNDRKEKTMVFNQKAFAKRVKEARNRKNLTQEQLAEKLSISVKHMGAIEQGTKLCSVEIIVEISEQLEVSTDYLLKGMAAEQGEIKCRLEAAAMELLKLSEQFSG